MARYSPPRAYWYIRQRKRRAQSWPFSGAVADYDFAGNRLFGPALTCVRASSAYVEDLAGNWTLVPANTLRRSNKGAPVEELRTNSALYSQQFDNAAWTKVATATVTANSGVGRDGTVSADTLNFPAGGDRVSQGISLPGGSIVTWSIFLSGSGTINLTINSSGGTFKTATKQVTLTSTLTRYDLTLTMNANNTGITVNVGRYDGVGPAGTATSVLAWQGQVEVGAFPSSIILTTGIAATRAADVITAPLSGLSAATLVAIGQHVVGSSGNNHSLASISDGTFNNRLIVYRSPSPGNMIATQWTGGAAASALGGVVNPNTRFAVASAFAANDRAMSVNGAAVAADAFALSFPSGLSQVQIGMNGASSGQWNGFIERLIVLPYRATNADVQRLSQLSTWGG